MKTTSLRLGHQTSDQRGKQVFSSEKFCKHSDRKIAIDAEQVYFYFPYLHKGSIGIEKKSPSEIFSEFHVSDYVDSEK